MKLLNHKMAFKIILNVVYFDYLICLSKSLSPCPSPEIAFPLVCYNGFHTRRLIQMDGKVEFNITQLALNISEYYSDSVEDKQLTELYLSYANIKVYEENCLLDLTFQEIQIEGNPNVVENYMKMHLTLQWTLKRLLIYVHVFNNLICIFIN